MRCLIWNPATFHRELPKSFVVPVEGPACGVAAAVALPREMGRRGGHA